MQVELPLIHERVDTQQTIGTLRVVASVDRALGRVWDRLLIELVGNGLKTMLVAAFMLLVFQYLVTRHLTQVARFVRDIDPARPLPSGRTLALDRPATGRWRPDILDAVTRSINGLLRSLEQARAERDASHEQLARSELRLRLSVEAAGAGLWDCDLAAAGRCQRRRPRCSAGGRAGCRWPRGAGGAPDDLVAALQACDSTLQQGPASDQIRMPTWAAGAGCRCAGGRRRAGDGTALRAAHGDIHRACCAANCAREGLPRHREMNADLVFQMTARRAALRVAQRAGAVGLRRGHDRQAFIECVAPGPAQAARCWPA
jgi:hypothetical protein